MLVIIPDMDVIDLELVNMDIIERRMGGKRSGGTMWFNQYWLMFVGIYVATHGATLDGGCKLRILFLFSLMIEPFLLHRLYTINLDHLSRDMRRKYVVLYEAKLDFLSKGKV